MEVTFREDSKTRAIIDVNHGTQAALLILKKELWNHDNVKACGLNKEHPLRARDTLVLETSGKDPRSCVEECAKTLYHDLKGSLGSVSASN